MEQELIVCIVNSGFADAVMDAARTAGARGGTIINGRGAARAEAEKKYSVTIHQDKDIVLIVSQVSLKESLLHHLYNAIGLNTDAQGFIFAVPVDDVVGFKNGHEEHQDLSDADEDE